MLMRRVNGFAESKRLSSSARSAGKRVRACLHKGDEGNTIVEMALMMPILMTVMLGIFVLGILFINYRALYQAVGDGSDFLQALSKDAAGTEICNATFNYMTGVAPTLNPNTLNVTITLNGAATTLNGTNLASNKCYSSGTNMAPGVNVSVSATYPCNFIIYGKDYSGGSCLLNTQPSTQLIY